MLAEKPIVADRLPEAMQKGVDVQVRAVEHHRTAPRDIAGIHPERTADGVDGFQEDGERITASEERDLRDRAVVFIIRVKLGEPP